MHFVLLLLAGCGIVTDTWYDTNVRDLDGDGHEALRFGGDDCDDTDASITLCDEDGDGFDNAAYGGLDCDDSDAAAHPDAIERCNGVDDDCDGLVDAQDEDAIDVQRFYDDLDEDGFGSGPARLSCDPIRVGLSLLQTDCDDTVASINPEATEFCDAIDQDCDGETHDLESADAVSSRVVDADQDGYTSGVTIGPGCVLPGELSAALAPEALDCDDNDSTVHPNAPEVFYDGIDQACDGPANDRDADQDGSPIEADCDDTDPLVYPGAVELCDGVDNDCNLIVDSDDPNIADPTLLFFRDGDGDGFGTPTQTRGFCVGDDSTGWVAASVLEDCNDTVASVNPFAVEVCNGIDDDCNGLTDDNATDTLVAFLDQDADGFGSVQVEVCPGAVGVSFLGGDCNDHPINGADIYPGAPELCGDGIAQDCLLPAGDLDCDRDGQDGVEAGGNDCDDTDPDVFDGAEELCDGKDNDCDGTADEGAADALALFVDADGDGFGGEAITACATPGLVSIGADCDDADLTIFPGAFEVCSDGILQDCATPDRQFDCDQDGADDDAFGGLDCDDTNAEVGPDAQEICDNLDNDCDHLIDGLDDSLDLTTIRDWFQDLDGDGFGSDVVVASAECSGPSDSVPNELDCDDADANVAPDLPELCDGKDNDCDLEIDEGNPIDAPVFYLDNDQDGYGGPTISASSCDPPAEGVWLLTSTDCNDVFDTVFPGAVEVCDGLDNDCDSALDDADQTGLADFLAWYRDDDGDLYGQVGEVLFQCAQPAGYSSISGDCDDANPDVQINRTWFRDLDGDGFGSHEFVEQCGEPVGYVLISGDCNDGEPQISPATPEVCDGVDNDCDTFVDDDDSLVAGAPAWYADEDRDQWGQASLGNHCLQPPGASIFPGDCDDSDPAIKPGAIELCDDGIDNNCNGLADDDDLDTVGKVQWYLDLDLDGFAGTPGAFACSAPGNMVPDDCDDADHSVHPAADEVCNGIDDNCNFLVDLQDPGLFDGIEVWIDNDHDTFGALGSQTVVCTLEPGFAQQGGDCDDTSAASFPGNPEICDGIDNDCNGPADDGLLVTYYEDTDSDGFVASFSNTIQACDGAPSHYLLLGHEDCNPDDPQTNPGAPEVCDGVDSNCDGNADSDLMLPIYFDFDFDGLGADPAGSSCPDDLPSSRSFLEGDCNDFNSNIGMLTWYPDTDGDGSGVPPGVVQCDPLPGHSLDPYDCDEMDPFVGASTQYWWDLDEDGFGDPAIEDRFCDPPADPLWVQNADDCNPSDNRAPQADNIFTVGHSGLFVDLEEALDVICSVSGAALSIQLNNPLEVGDFDLTPFSSVTIRGLGRDLTIVQGSLRGNSFSVEDLTVEGPRPVVDSTSSLQLDNVRLLPDDGPGSAVIASFGINLAQSEMQIDGGTAFELADDFGGDLQINDSVILAVGPTLRVFDSGSSFGFANVSNSVVGGLWVSLVPGPANFSSSRSTLVTPGSLGTSDTSSSRSVISIGSGTCSSVFGETFSNEPTCATMGGDLGLQTWHPDLDPALWDFHLNVNSDAYLNGAGARHGDYSLSAAGLPAYWEALHGVACLSGDEDDDLDNVPCLAEYAQGTSPALSDTDGDSVPDDVDNEPLNPNVQ